MKQKNHKSKILKIAIGIFIFSVLLLQSQNQASANINTSITNNAPIGSTVNCGGTACGSRYYMYMSLGCSSTNAENACSVSATLPGNA